MPFKALAILLCMHFAPAAGAAEVFGIVGDAGRWNSNAHSVCESLLRSGVNSLILPGDNLYDHKRSQYDSTWRPWRESGFTFDIVALGNHRAGYQEEIAYFDMPGEYYVKKISPGIKFIVLNSDNEKAAREQAEWFENELLAADEPVVFVVYHHPSLTVHGKHGWKEKKKFHERILPLLDKYRQRITAVLSGHNHVAGLFSFDDIPVVISAATQELQKPEKPEKHQKGRRVRALWQYEDGPHWARLAVNGETGLVRLDFIRAADDEVQFTACLRKGEPAVAGCPPKIQ